MAQFPLNTHHFDPYKNYPYKNFNFRIKWDGKYVAGVSKSGGVAARRRL